MSDKGEHKKHRSGGHGGGHGGGGHEEAHEGAPEWLISFADNVALMMGFFVILLAMNMSKQAVGGGGSKGDTGQVMEEKTQMLDFALAVREAFNNPVDINSGDPREQELVDRLRQKAGKSETTDPGVKGHEQDVQSIRPSEYYAVSGNVSFAENSNEVTSLNQRAIADVADKMRGLNLVVDVRGHVSSVEAARGPEAASRLSFERAQAVARTLAEAGVDWWRMRLVLAADHDRIDRYPRNSAADRANARVEIILTDEVVPEPVPTRSD